MSTTVTPHVVATWLISFGIAASSHRNCVQFTVNFVGLKFINQPTVGEVTSRVYWLHYQTDSVCLERQRRDV